jgi:hypothetical protein
LIQHCSKINLHDQLASDGLQKRIHDAPDLDISKSLIYHPFHTDEITMSYDHYMEDTNIFTKVEADARLASSHTEGSSFDATSNDLPIDSPYDMNRPPFFL